MVRVVNPVRLLVKLPTPAPSRVFVGNATVGPAEVLQQTPRAVTGVPLSFVMTPPQLAVVEVMEVTAMVVKMGTVPAPQDGRPPTEI